MIICGYPCIGKTSISTAKNRIIDLESSMFNDNNGKKNPGWEKTYCRIAEDLSAQGYTVFVSTHQVVLDYLKDSNHRVVLIYPHADLYKEWVERAEKRYKDDPSKKNKAALDNVKANFVEQTKSLDTDAYLMRYPLVKMDYDLLTIVNSLKH